MNINGTALSVKEFNKQRVVTFKDVDQVHKRADGTARRNFTTNKKHFIENDDFYIVKPCDIQMGEIRSSEINNRGTTLLTESGYLMLVKSFTDDLAWTVQRELVNNYFRVKETALDLIEPPAVMCYRNIPVTTCRELGRFIAVEATKIGSALRLSTGITPNKDYFLLKEQSLEWFKENNDYPYYKIASLYVITQSGALKIMAYFGIAQNRVNTVHALLSEAKDAYGLETDRKVMNRRRAMLLYLFDKLDVADQDKMLIDVDEFVIKKAKNSQVVQNMIENF